MTAIAGKIRDFFSDLMLNIELMFSHKPKEDMTPAQENSAVRSDVSGVIPVTDTVPHTDGEMQIMDMQEKAVQEKKERLQSTNISSSLKHLRLPVKTRLHFYDQMATLVGAGVPLIDSLSLIQAQEKNKNIKKLYTEMIHEINAGMSLAESMEMFPHIFPRMQSALVEAAEASGNLKEVLAELVEEMESNQDFLKKVTGAMVYPVILLVLALGLVTGMMTFVIPKVAAMYEQANVQLPAITQTVIDVSDFTVAKWPLLLGGTIALIAFLYFFFVKLTAGRLIGETIVAALPVIGHLNKQKNIMIIASNMAMLMRSGVLITEAFAITRKTVNNLHYQKALEEIRQGVVMGKEVSQMMGLEDIRTQKFREHPLFPLQMAQMIHIGETTGTIAKMLMKIKHTYHKSIDYSLKNISTLVEPLMIFIVAALVGTILMAVMLPFFYIGSTIN